MWGGSSRRRTNARLKRTRAIGALVAVLAVFVAVFGVVSAAQAAVDDADHTVAGVSPRGTTINVFDYWIQSRDANDQSNGEDYQNRGINANHVLKFGAGMGNSNEPYIANRANVNFYTNSARPRTSIVGSELGEDGYPSLARTLGGSSLSYLFDGTSSNGKAAYMDVDGLLQVDDEGYYYYNSQQNFAQFNDDGNGSGDFTLYRQPGVDAGGASPGGQFFPFDNGSEIFEEPHYGNQLGYVQVWDQTLDGGRGGYRNVKSTDANMNHYFGLSMSTRFIQQDGGYTAPQNEGGRPVTYNFSGDDDVWVYIDGVLVGDLGGIHDKTSLEINFATGRVYVYDDADNDNQYDRGETVYNGGGQGEYLAQIMRDAGVTTGLDGNTFADNTYHTLDFFYLERGNTDSNMSLKYNLVNIPESGVVKVDQAGDEMGGVSFTLHRANDQYNIVDGGMEVSGRTDANGEMIFTTTNAAGQEMPITLEQLQEQGGNYWVLTEDGTPEGYRSNGDVQLRFEDGVLLASNEWDTGAYSQPHVTAVAPTQVRETGTNDMSNSADGTMFAVVFQKGADGDWYPVYGDAFNGWTVSSENDMATVVDAAKADPNQFLLGSGGAYEVTIEDLPGDITTYAYMLRNHGGNEANAKYTVRYYWSSADSMRSVTAANTHQIDADADGSYEGMDRVFSVTLNIPNIKNELSLVKTDRGNNDAPMEDVEFALFSDDDRDGVADGTTALSTMTTDKNGELQVYSDKDAQILANGNYVLVETTPDGYVEETDPIQIVVDDDGVHVNAGDANDNVTVETGIGSLVYSMKGFAAGDQVDATLHDVKAQAQTATEYVGENTEWANDASAAESHFQYGGTADLSYVLNQTVENNGGATYVADVGWSRLNLQQCMSHSGDAATGPKQNLADEGVADLNALFTGAVTIHVTNAKTPSDLTIPANEALQITKNLTATGNAAADMVNAEAGAYQFTIKAVDTKNGDTVTTTAAEAAEKLGLTGGSTQMTVDSSALTPGTGDNANVWSGTTNPLTNGLTFTAADRGKTFTYEISEVVPKDVPAGYVYDDEPHTVTYTVSGGTTTNLSVEASVDGNEVTEGAPIVTFNNAVNASTIDGGDPANTALQVKKTVNVPTDRDFTFGLSLESAKTADGADIADGAWETDDNGDLVAFDGMTAEATNDFTADALTQTAAFDQITLTKPGTYTFSVSENVPEDKGGWTYDTDKTITVTVADDMSVTVNPEDRTAAFTNTYSATGDLPLDGTGDIELTKALTGRDWIDGDEFTFTLSGKNVTAGADESTGFSLPENTTATVGYKDAVAAAGSEATEDVAVPFSFDPITFTQTGTYEFTVTEGAIDEKNVTNTSGTSVTYRVEVTDNVQDGELEVGTPTVVSQTGTGAFVNTYDPSAATAGMRATKTLNGRSKGIEAGAFTFEVQNVEKPDGVETAPMPSNAADGSVTNDVDGVINFGTLAFDAEGTYAYQISEVNEGKTGYTYDSTAYTVVYDVSDDPETGALLANATYYAGEVAPENAIDAADVVFANTYDPEDVTVDPDPDDANAGFSGTKTVTDEHGEYGTIAAGDFSFVIAATQAPAGLTAPLPSNVDENGQVSNDASGAFDFGTITFSDPGEYTYEVREVTSDKPGITNSSEIYTLHFNVVDHGGKLAIDEQTITNAAGEPVSGTELNFENIYNDGETSYAIGGTKVLDTNGYEGAALEQGDYTFVLVDEDGNEVDRVTNGAANGSTAAFQFDPITYTEAGTHTYKVYELGADGKPGTGGTDDARVTHDDAVYTVTVNVTEANDGRGLAASADVANADIVFTNTYEPTPVVVGPSGSAQIGGTKVLNVAEGSNRTMAAGEFEFLLLEGETEVGRTTNAADGSFAFDDITYDAAGTHHYTVSEISAGQGGVTYDSTLYSVTVDVTENAQTHALEATVTYVNNADMATPVDQMVFTNTYKAAPTTAVLGVSKELKGGTLADGQFTFQLTGSEGAPMPEAATATNAADGSVSFGAITFDAAGEYDYTVTEVNDAQDGVTYDADATRTIHVSVTDDGAGHLVAEVTYGADGSHFVNASTSGEKNPGGEPGNGNGTTGNNPQVTIPKTGDVTFAYAPAIALLGVAVVAGGIFARKALRRR